MLWNILGHETAISFLKNHAKPGHTRHAYLITGPDGVGRETLALAFVLVGMPLGIVAHRGETSVGAAISLALVGLNYAFIICVEALQERVWLHPHLLVWIPNAVFAVLGPWLTWRLDRR